MILLNNNTSRQKYFLFNSSITQSVIVCTEIWTGIPNCILFGTPLLDTYSLLLILFKEISWDSLHVKYIWISSLSRKKIAICQVELGCAWEGLWKFNTRLFRITCKIFEFVFRYIFFFTSQLYMKIRWRKYRGYYKTLQQHRF